MITPKPHRDDTPIIMWVYFAETRMSRLIWFSVGVMSCIWQTLLDRCIMYHIANPNDAFAGAFLAGMRWCECGTARQADADRQAVQQ